jgi:hypothetical protein
VALQIDGGEVVGVELFKRPVEIGGGLGEPNFSDIVNVGKLGADSAALRLGCVGEAFGVEGVEQVGVETRVAAPSFEGGWDVGSY